MRVIVTGATGFLGRPLVAALVAQGHEVHRIQRRPDETRADGTREILWDLRDPSPPPSLPGSADAIVHLAVSDGRFPEAARETFLVNAASTLALLEWGTGAGVARFVLASTGAVYGAGRMAPYSEMDRPDPATFYGWTKRVAEQAVERYATAVSGAILRLFFPYGPGQRGRLFADLILRAWRGEPLELFNGGRLRYNPVFIDDVVEVFLRVIASDRPMMLNVAGAECLTMREIVEVMGTCLGRAAALGFVDRPNQDSLVGDIEQLKRLLGYQPQTDLRTGMTRTVGAFLEAHGASACVLDGPQ